MEHFSEGKHLKEVMHIPLTFPLAGSMGGLVGQGLACHATATLVKLFLQESSKSSTSQVKATPWMCLKRRTHSLELGTSSDWSAEQYGEHGVEDNGIVEVFSVHDHPSKRAQQETKRASNAAKYQVLRFHFPTLPA